nr:hypothetical protein [Marinicella sp. W31]MDC2879283.1 hypothetical protein [Marinicella sp. W31]
MATAQKAGARIYDASRGMQYRKAHVEGARWVTRARLTRKMPATRPSSFSARQSNWLPG